MSENQGFVHDEITVVPATPTGQQTDSTNANQGGSGRKRSMDIGTSTAQIIIESEPPASNRDCWSSMCDVFGTRQSAYITQLRPISTYLLRCQEALKIFQYELERDIKTKQSALATYQHVMDCVIEINHISMHRDLNIPPDEHTMLRSVVYEMALLARIIEEVANQASGEKSRSRSNSFQRLTISAPSLHTTTEGDETRDIGSGENIPAVDVGSLKDNITKVFEMVENMLKYIDKKTERRWWLRDVINFTQAAVKVALFISAAISVAYHENQIAPIITLVITVIQGITEGFDQYFLKNKSPDDIHISVLTNTMNNLKKYSGEMKDSCKVSKSTTNHRIDMNKSLDITAAIHHFESVSQFLRDDYSGARELCDVTLRFDDESIPAHWVMLAAYSPAFAEKFRKPNKCFVLEMQPLDKTSVKRVLDYIYFGKVTFRLATLHEDLKAISYFEIVTLQEDVEKRLVELAKGNCVDVLNLVTANLKTIPHSPSTILLISDESVRDIVSILHDTYSTNRLSYEEILSLSTNTVITCLSARIPDFKKVDIINMSLKWIYERHLNDHKACKILQGLTLGSMTYAELVNLRNSLIQTAIPVTIGRCVRLKRRENDTLDIVFTYGESSGYQKPGIKPTITSSFTMNNDPTSGAGTPSTKTSRSPSNKFDDAISESWNVNLDDCNTAMSFNDEDLKRLGIEKSKKMKKKEQEEM